MAGFIASIGKAVGRRLRAGRGEPARRFIVEALGRAADAALYGRPDPNHPVATIVEALEVRLLPTTTFNAFVSATATGHTSGYVVNLWTTGGQASQWVVHWGDNTPDSTFYASQQQGGVFPTPYFTTPAHMYNTGQNYRITATATPTVGSGVSASFALNSAFGSVASQGETTATPSGATGNAGGIAIAVDTSGGTYNGYIYSLSYYGSYAAVTRFTPSGAVDTAFGDTINTPGTRKLTGLGTGTPTSIAVSPDGKYVAVGGQFNGWGAALIDTTSSQAGSIKWTESDLVSSGKINALAFESTHAGDFVLAAGAVNGCSPHASCGALAELNTTDGCFTAGFNSACGPVTFAPSGNTCEYATGVVDLDGDYDGFAVAGYCTYSGGSDFTLIEFNDDGSVLHSIVRTNIGNTLGSANGAVNTPSTDTATSLTYDPVTKDLIVAGYTNATSSTIIHIGLVAYNGGDLSLDTNFGAYTDGVSVGPPGKANSIVLVSSSAGTVAVGGTYNNDFQACQFTTKGALDSNNFGNGGIFDVDFGDTSTNSTDGAGSIAVETDGSILLGGSTTPNGGNAAIALADLLANPSVSIT